MNKDLGRCGRPHIMRRAALFVALGALVTVTACNKPSENAVRVTIPIGSSFRAATDSLANAGMVRQPLLFRLYARIQRRDRTIHPGTYLFRRGTSWNTMIASLNEGDNVINRVTIPEGFSVAQIVPLLAHHLNVPPESVAIAVRDSTLLTRLGVPTPTLEGYLFPDTYMFPPGTSARQAVAELVKRFEREWKLEYDSSLHKLGMTRHEVMTIASIVEKEAKVADERPTIAGVYYNRLRKKMPLQADPTVQYALGRHVERVMFDHLKTESPYNTYLNPGLPPGPIASPGGASIQAALNPADVPYLYFVAAPDGHHEFSTTLEGHNEAIRALRAKLARLSEKPSSQPPSPRKGEQGTKKESRKSSTPAR